MGFFTWTDAKNNPSTLKLTKHGDYYRKDLIEYDGFAKVVCPDNCEIIENCYEGYGIFGKYDVFELVVDWNKEYLEDIFKKISCDPTSEKYRFGYRYKDIAIAYQNDDKILLQKSIDKLIQEEKEGKYLRTDWKRVIGITISCDSNFSDMIVPYPIKITTIKKHVKYDELYPSISCQ